ncbi:MAG: hypothetical protein R3C53_21350 [Pirellulaceae bacterium]
MTAPVSGSSNFQQEFEARGQRDTQGRSLRDLDLTTRVFRYPCSYLIYNPAFDGLPPEVRSQIVDKLGRILSGEMATEQFAHLTPEIRRELTEILTETKPELGLRVARAQSPAS